MNGEATNLANAGALNYLIFTTATTNNAVFAMHKLNYTITQVPLTGSLLCFGSMKSAITVGSDIFIAAAVYTGTDYQAKMFKILPLVVE